MCKDLFLLVHSSIFAVATHIYLPLISSSIGALVLTVIITISYPQGVFPIHSTLFNITCQSVITEKHFHKSKWMCQPSSHHQYSQHADHSACSSLFLYAHESPDTMSTMMIFYHHFYIQYRK